MKTLIKLSETVSEKFQLLNNLCVDVTVHEHELAEPSLRRKSFCWFFKCDCWSLQE